MKVYINDKTDNLIISISGSINTETVTNLRNSVESIDFDSFNSVELDFQSVDYISSAGLRELLVMQKRFSKDKIHVLNVNENVYDVFKMTGFTDMFDVSLAEKEDDPTRLSFKHIL